MASFKPSHFVYSILCVYRKFTTAHTLTHKHSVQWKWFDLLFFNLLWYSIQTYIYTQKQTHVLARKQVEVTWHSIKICMFCMFWVCVCVCLARFNWIETINKQIVYPVPFLSISLSMSQRFHSCWFGKIVEMISNIFQRIDDFGSMLQISICIWTIKSNFRSESNIPS